MKIIPLHKTNTTIVYKNSLCSTATVWVLIFITLSVMLPVLLVSLLSPYSGIMESRVLYEQPRLYFKYQYIFIATLETSAEQPTAASTLVACSTFANFNARMAAYSEHCEGVKYWLEDLDYDTYTDRAHFDLQLVDLPASIKSIELVLFFDAQLKHKCMLSPPAVLTQQQILPSDGRLQAGRIALKAELQLKQYVEFACPFPGRNTKTEFRHVQLDTNNSYADIAQYQMESLLAQVKANPAYFQLDVQQTFYTHESPLVKQPGLRIELELDILQVPARYHLSIWERLGQFWLYFASFFGISFYIMNRLKDVLFGRHIIRSYETIPWKKLY